MQSICSKTVRMWPRNDLQDQTDSLPLSPLSSNSLRSLIHYDFNSSHPLVYRTTFTTITFDVCEIANATAYTTASSVDEFLCNDNPSVMASSRASTIKTPLLNVEECYTVTLIPESMYPCDFEEEFYAALLPPSPESPPSASPPPPPPVQRKPPADTASTSHRKKNASLPQPDDSDKEQHELPMTRARARQLQTTDSLLPPVCHGMNPKTTNLTAQRDKLSEAFRARKAAKTNSPENAGNVGRSLPKRKESLKRPAELPSVGKSKKTAGKTPFERNLEDHEDIARLSQGSMPPADDNDFDGSDNTEIVSTLNGSVNLAHVPKIGNINAAAQISTYTSIFEPAPPSQQQRSAPNITSTTFNSKANVVNNISTTTITVNSNVAAARKPAITKPESSASHPNSIMIQTASQQQRHRNITNPQETSNLSISTRTVRFAADTRFNPSSPQNTDLTAEGLMSPPVSSADNGIRGNTLSFSYFDAQPQQSEQVPIEVDDGSEDNEQPNEPGNSSTKPEAVSVEMEVDDDNEAEVGGGRGGIDSSVVSLDGSNDSQRPPSQAFSQVIVTRPREIRKTTTAAVPKRAVNAASTVQHSEISSSSSVHQRPLHRTSSQPATQQQQVSIESVRQHTAQFEAQIAATASEVSRRTDAEITSAVTAINSARNNTNLFGTHLRGSATAVAEMRRAIEELNRPRTNEADEFAALNAVIESNVDAESEQIWKLVEERLRAMQAEISSANVTAYTTGRLMAQAMQMQLHMSRRICADSSLYAGAIMQTIGQARERMRQVYSRMMQDNVDMLNELGFDQPQQQTSRDNNSRAAAVPPGGGARRG